MGFGARPFVPRGRSSRARSSVGRAAGRGAGLNLRRNITEALSKCRAALIRSAWRRASTTKGAGPHPCGAGAEWASLGDISPVERRCFRLHGGTAQLLSSCCMACLTWAWARGVPASWRSWRPLHEASTPMHIYARARTATGWGTPYLKIVVLTVFAPQDAGDEPPPCLWHEAVRAALCEHRRRGARGGVRGDLGRWCCNARAGGESLISS